MPFINLIVVLINLPRLLLHLLVFAFFYNKCKDDVKVNMASRGYSSGVVLSFLYLLVFEKPFRNLFYWRIGKLKYLLWYLLWPHPCFTLATDMKAGPGFNCIHPFATTVNAVSIGENFTVRNTVTIGNNKSGERPVIGKNVSVSANAVVIGPIEIGDNVIIGAGAVVTKSVPSNCVVVGNPAFILKENGILVKRPL